MARISAPPTLSKAPTVITAKAPVTLRTQPLRVEEPQVAPAEEIVADQTEVGAFEALEAVETPEQREKQKRDPQHVIALRELAVLKKQAERLRDRFSSWITPGKMKLSLQALEMAMCDTVTGTIEVEADLQSILDSGYTPTKYSAREKVLEAGAEVRFVAAYAEAYAEVFEAPDLDRLFVVRVTDAGKYIVGIGDPTVENGLEQTVGIHEAKHLELK